MRRLYHHMLDRLFRSYAFRERLTKAVQDSTDSEGLRSLPPLPDLPNPYASSAVADAAAFAEGDQQQKVLFISSRFRSGSTLLWNIFHALDGFTSYYEPLNERQWFVPTDDAHVDPTHRGAINYRANYEDMADLKRLYRKRWIDQNLIMHARSHDQGLKCYLDALINRAEGVPVLQFNRVDFRLPWLKAVYPHANILHLYRNPRDQWASILYKQSVPRDVTLADFGPYDKFYLIPWYEDLRRSFTCLDHLQDVSAYEAHYLIWRLSYLYGKAFADASVAYEDLVSAPQKVMSGLLNSLGMDDVAMGTIADMIDTSGASSWQSYADESWFSEKEQRCEEALSSMITLLKHV